MEKPPAARQARYTEADILSLDWREHIRLRPGMYVGKLGDGSEPEDGIYLLFKEVTDNAIDEHLMGYGRQIEITCDGKQLTVRDYGRGMPLGKVVDCVAKINTGGKYEGDAFHQSVGLNGVGLKAVNALSASFEVVSHREGKSRQVVFQRGLLAQDHKPRKDKAPDGCLVSFVPDPEVFGDYAFDLACIEAQITYYTCLNPGLTILLNGRRYASPGGLSDLLAGKLRDTTTAYPIIHLQGGSIAFAMVHDPAHRESYYTFVNGQHTAQGGTHLNGLRDALPKVLNNFFRKHYQPSDVRSHLVAALSVRVTNPIFESQTKLRLGSQQMEPDGPAIRTAISDFLEKELDDYLHQHPDTARAIAALLEAAAAERKELSGLKKLAGERAKKMQLHNKKLRDCTVHFSSRHKRREETTLFITEGNSASGSITQARDVQTQAVFSLRGKPLNSYGQSKRLVYENEEFNGLQHALDLEKGLAHLRYNQVVIATDADVDGMHIRLLVLTFFLQFFPQMVEAGHLYILETPLFRVRNGKESLYCYSEAEMKAAVKKLKGNTEVTRFKGLGEISPHEFKHFIGASIRLLPVRLLPDTPLEEILGFYMGKNSPERQKFIIDNLRSSIQV